MADLANMFDDVDFDLVLEPKPRKQIAPRHAAPAAPSQPAEIAIDSLATPRDALGDLDSMLEKMAEAEKWKPTFAVGDEVEAIYDEDDLWYLARIDVVQEESEDYLLTFTEYGNEQVTKGECIRPTLSKMMEDKEKELAPAVEEEMKRKMIRRKSLILQHPELIKKKPVTKAPVPEVDSNVEPSTLHNMGKTFDSVMVKDEDSVPDTVLKEGVMSADERKAFILAQARKLGLSNQMERTLVAVDTSPQRRDSSEEDGKRSHSDRHLQRKDHRHLGRARSSSVVEGNARNRLPVPATASNGIFGDMDALVQAEKQARQRADSESSVAPVNGQRKVWADNPLSRK